MSGIPSESGEKQSGPAYLDTDLVPYPCHSRSEALTSGPSGDSELATLSPKEPLKGGRNGPSPVSPISLKD